MFRIRRLYTEPETFDPVCFEDGVNFILGVEDRSSDKTNGVGKTLCIEFINFALFKHKNHSRLDRIPVSAFSESTLVCLDIEANREKFTIKRSLLDSERPTILSRESQTTFAKLDDAKAYIDAKLHTSALADVPSFRALLGPLVRDERSEFKSIVGRYDTDRKVPDDYSPHVYLLGLDLSLFKRIKSLIDRISEIGKDINRVKNNVRIVWMKDIGFARSDLNQLSWEVDSIEESIEALENITGYEIVKDEILELENLLEKKRRERMVYSQKFHRTNLIETKVPIDVDEVAEYYQSVNERLGDIVKRDLEEVIKFQTKIYEFQNQLIQEKRDELAKVIDGLDTEILELDKRHMSRLSLIDKVGSLKNIKQTYAIFQEKSEEFNALKAFIARYDELQELSTREKAKKAEVFSKYIQDITLNKAVIQSIEQSILEIHKFVQGNNRASFEVNPSGFRQLVEIDLQIDDDGSHSIEREKVFIYDLALLINEHTSKLHPGILIHDNIFEVDQNTLTKNLTFLLKEARFTESQQYILTLNADRLTDEVKAMIRPHVRAEFTEERRFLKTKYTEDRTKR